MTPLQACRTIWSALSLGFFKINVDASIPPSTAFIEVGVVIRDAQGIVLLTQATRIFGIFSSQVAELLAVRESIKVVQNHWNQGILETDAKNVVKAINHPFPFYADVLIVSCIRQVCCHETDFIVHHYSRSANKVAHALASRDVTHGQIIANVESNGNNKLVNGLIGATVFGSSSKYYDAH
ncbi:uncharacterized protein [Henckelia pumila]|uniref:uncharacterized protein n=1 Tax=Henckelia pumila TaxID=405737 RepID=UPI003C6E3F4F